TAFSIVYAYMVTPTYQTRALLKTVPEKELDQINRSGLVAITPEQALFMVERKLDSYELWFDFFKQNPELFQDYVSSDRTEEENFARFYDKKRKITKPDPPRSDRELVNRYIRLEVDYPRGVDGPAIANGMVDLAIGAYKDDVLAAIDTARKNSLASLSNQLLSQTAGYLVEIDSRIAQLAELDNIRRLRLEEELNAIQENLKTVRENRIKELEEAIAIAKVLNISKPTTPTEFRDSS